MLPLDRNERAPAPRFLLAVALLLSAGLHAAVGFFGGSAFRPPSLGIEFQVPIDVELGMTDEVAAAAARPSPPVVPEPPSRDATAAAGPTNAEAAPAKPKRKPKPPRSDAPDAGTEATRDAGAGALSSDTNGTSRLPPGAQIALRMDLERVRHSPLAPDVRALLEVIPDWKALLAGSGIDPVEQLDRLLIATPNLQRSSVVLAGRFVGSVSIVEEAVTKLADARGITPTWRDIDGVRIAPWANQDETPRVVALVGPSHFTLSRAEDLPRMLAIAAARGALQADAGVTEVPADALLSMQEGEVLSLEVEGVTQFVRRAKRGIPRRLHVALVEAADGRVALKAELSFDDEQSAADGLSFWSAVRDSYARNALIAILGLSEPLREGSIERAASQVDAQLWLSGEQVRLILGYLRPLLAPPPPVPPLPGDGPEPATVPLTPRAPP